MFSYVYIAHETFMVVGCSCHIYTSNSIAAGVVPWCLAHKGALNCWLHVSFFIQLSLLNKWCLFSSFNVKRKPLFRSSLFCKKEYSFIVTINGYGLLKKCP